MTAVFSLLAVIAWISFKSLKEQAPAKITSWEIMAARSEYPIKATYTFEAQGKRWEGSFLFDERAPLNEASAVDAVYEMAKKSWVVWYQPSHPLHSVLEKRAPFSLVGKALVCLLVSFYLAFHRRVLMKGA